MSSRIGSMFLALLLVSASGVFSCTSQSELSKNKGSLTSISFGKEGGFTNLTELYTIGSDGVVHKAVENAMERIHKISKKEWRELEREVEKLQFESMDISERGNMTYFIEVRSSSYSNKATWSDSELRNELFQLYLLLVSKL